MGIVSDCMGENAVELKFHHCRIIVEFSFPAVIAFLFLQSDLELLKQSFFVCLIHELGHGIVMTLTGAGIREVRFYAAGIRMTANTCLLSTFQMLAVYFSGPLMNLLCALLFWKYQPVTALLHLSMGIFNLLPYRILDGGAALESLFETKGDFLQIRSRFCMLLSVSLLFLLHFYKILSPALFLMVLYLAFSEISVDKSRSL